MNDQDPAIRAAMIDLQTFLKYEKQLRNLQIQEARLHRRYEKDFAELRKLQQKRKTKQGHALDAAARQYLAAKKQNQAFDPAANGFEFSIAEIQRHIIGSARASFEQFAQSAVRRTASTDLGLASEIAKTGEQAA